MNLKTLSFGVVISIVCIYCVGKNTQESTTKIEEASVQMGELFQLDTLNSLIEWVGSAPGDYKHNGTLRFTTGTLSVMSANISSADLEVNMNSIAALDQTGKDKINLEKHLKNHDFFEVEKFPKGKFELVRAITTADSVGYNTEIHGNLTLKEKTLPVDFRAKVSLKDSTLIAESANFTIDRTKWGIVYSSGIIGTLKDEMINDEIILKVKLIATRKNM